MDFYGKIQIIQKSYLYMIKSYIDSFYYLKLKTMYINPYTAENVYKLMDNLVKSSSLIKE